MRGCSGSPCDRASAQVHHGLGTKCDDRGPLGSSAARPGLGMGGKRGVPTARSGQGPDSASTVLTVPGRWHLPATLAVWTPMNYREAPLATGECGDHDGRRAPPLLSLRDVPRPACLELRGGVPVISFCGGATAPPSARRHSETPSGPWGLAVLGGRHLR